MVEELLEGNYRGRIVAEILPGNHRLEITVSGQIFWSLLKMTIRAPVRNYRWRVQG
jgi:hypothetical protein